MANDRPSWPASDLYLKMANGSFSDLTPCPKCACPAAAHYGNPSTRALECPPAGSDPLKLAEMIARAPKMPKTPSFMDPASMVTSSRELAQQALARYRQRLEEDRLAAAAAFAGDRGIGLPPPYAPSSVPTETRSMDDTLKNFAARESTIAESSRRALEARLRPATSEPPAPVAAKPGRRRFQLDEEE